MSMLDDTLKPSDVARRHGLTPQQLFGWHRQALNEDREHPHGPPPSIHDPFNGARYAISAARRALCKCLRQLWDRHASI